MFAPLTPPREWSLEATHPNAGEIVALAAALPGRCAVYLSAPPHAGHERQLRAAAALREAGFDPVPHVAARHFASESDLERYLERMRRDAQVEQVLLIAGDLGAPRGPFASSFDLLASTPFRRSGISRAGMTGYPAGHPAISHAALRQARKAKTAAARETGIELHFVTQFEFTAAPIGPWLDELAAEGLGLAVRIGLAGPASLRTLLRFAIRCGVDAPLGQAGLAARLLKAGSPDALVEELRRTDSVGRYPGPVSIHLYSFGGLARTAAWLQRARLAGAASAEAVAPMC